MGRCVSANRRGTRYGSTLWAGLLVAILIPLVGGSWTEGSPPPWPSFRHDASNTGYSPIAGPPTSNGRWAYTAGGEVASSPAVGWDRTVYFGCADGNLYAIQDKVASVAGKWTYPTSGPVNSSPAIGPDGTIYFGSDDGHLYALHDNGTSATEKWKAKTDGPISSSPAIGTDGTIYFGSSDKKFYALRGCDGKLKWSSPYATGGPITSSPAIGPDGTIYFGSDDKHLYALKGSDGKLKWKYATGDSVQSSPAIGPDGTIYFGSNDGKFYALGDNKTSGKLKWNYTTGCYGKNSPAIGPDGTIYFASDKWAYAFRNTKTSVQKLWQDYLDAKATGSPVIGPDGTIYFGRSDGGFQAFKTTSTGLDPKWTYTAPSAVTSSPAIGSDGTIYFGAGSQLHGVGQSQRMDVQSGGDLLFPDTFVGDTAKQTGVYQVQNTGGGTLNVTVTAQPPFDAQPPSFSLGASAKQSIDVTFAPYAAGAFTGGIVFNSNGGAGSRTAKGTGVLPVVEVKVGKGETKENEPDKPATLSLQRSGGLGSPLTVTYTTSGTAQNGVHYQKLPGSLTIPKGQAAATLPLVPIDNQLAEGDKTALLQFPATTGYAVDPVEPDVGGKTKPFTFKVLFTDNEPVVGITAPDSIGSEPGTNTATFEVTRRTATGSPLPVKYQLKGTAKPGKDYLVSPTPIAPGSVTIPADQKSAFITVTPLKDALQEGPETVVATLVGASTTGYSIDPAAKSAQAVLFDGPAGPPGVLAVQPTDDLLFPDTTAGDTATQLGAYTVQNTGGGTLNVTVTAQPPFHAQPQTFILGPGATQSLDVTFAPTGAGPSVGAILFCKGDGQDFRFATGTGVLPIVQAQVTEGVAREEDPAHPGVVTLQRSGGLASPLTVNYTVSGTAKDDMMHFERPPGSVTFPIGEPSATVPIIPINNMLADGDSTVVITPTPGPTYQADPVSPSGLVWILDDEPVVAIGATDPIASEPGANTATFEVARRTVSPSPLTVKYKVTGTAKAGKDFQLLPSSPGSVTIPGGQTSAQITLFPFNDSIYAGAKSVVVTLTGASPDTYSIYPAANSARALIFDDEPVVSIEAAQPTAKEEGQVPAKVAIRRTGSCAGELKVTYTLSPGGPGKATYGTDYTISPSPVYSVTVPWWQSSVEIALTPKADALREGPETVTVTLTAPAKNSPYGIDPARKTAVVTIEDAP